MTVGHVVFDPQQCSVYSSHALHTQVQSYLEQTQEPEEDGVGEEGAVDENGGAAGVKDEEEQEEDEQPVPEEK